MDYQRLFNDTENLINESLKKRGPSLNNNLELLQNKLLHFQILNTTDKPKLVSYNAKVN